ncbi:MAG: nucleoid occlusion factor SlmA [Burkholderiaceae bacterium]
MTSDQEQAAQPGDNSKKPARRTRLKPGERRNQILQTLAQMLQEPGADRVTTAALAARMKVSEAALYRHFASKAQMFEGLIDFIERSLFSLINRITTQEPNGRRQAIAIVEMLLGFAEKNPGMTRVLVGDALILEDDRLQRRINQMIDRIGVAIKQSVRNGITQDVESTGPVPVALDPEDIASCLLSFVLGRWLRFVKSDFKKPPLASMAGIRRCVEV